MRDIRTITTKEKNLISGSVPGKGLDNTIAGGKQQRVLLPLLRLQVWTGFG